MHPVGRFLTDFLTRHSAGAVPDISGSSALKALPEDGGSRLQPKTG